MPAPRTKKPAAPKAVDPAQDRKHKDFEPSQAEKDAVSTWLGRVKRAEENPRRKDWADNLERQRAYVYGQQTKDASGNITSTRTNLIFATLAAMMPHLYARNPDIAITASTACPEAKLPVVKKFCETAQDVVWTMLVREGKLKKRSKSNIRSTMTTSYGVLKMVFQQDFHGDPIVIRRIQDAQDNIARIEALAKKSEENLDMQDLAAQREQARELIKGLLAQNEVKVWKGFAVDRVKSEYFYILDDSIEEFDEYVDAGALGHAIFMTRDDFTAKFGYEPFGATTYEVPTQKEGAQKPAWAEGMTEGEKYVCVIEIWDKTAGLVRTVAKGMGRWVREPFAPKNTPQRWYPFFVLGFNLVEGRWRPISDVELLQKLMDEYDETRQNFADVRKDAVPVRVFRKAGNLTPEDIETLSQKRRNRDWIGVEGNPSVPLDQDIMQLEGPKIDPQAYDVSLIRNDMDLVVGLSDASRANLIKPKTATEAEIMEQALGLRVGERRDANEDLMGEMAEAALEVALRALTKDEVKHIAGEEAEWPESQDLADIFALIEVNVRAGSSGRPDAQKEREQWTEVLPIIQKTMETVAELRAQGQFELADAAITLLRETLSRFDERLDIDSIIPPVQKGEDGKPVQTAASMLAQLQQQFTQTKEQLAECQQALQKAEAQEQSRMAKIASDERIADAEIRAKSGRAVAEAFGKADLAKHVAVLKAAAEVMASSERAGNERMQVSELVDGLKATMATLEQALAAVNNKGAASPAAGSASS